MPRRSYVDCGVETSYLDIGAGRPCVVLHGFTGSAEAMAPISEPLAAGRRVLAVDLVGHGQSSSPDTVSAYTLDAVVDRLSSLLAEAGPAQFDLLGYSMGGRVALTFAARNHQRIRKLVLISSTAGLESSDARRERAAADRELAATIEADGVEAFIDKWQELPLFATQQRLPGSVKARIRAGRLGSSATGLANSLRGSGTGEMAPLWEALPELATPTLVVVGSLDERYVAIGQRLSASLPNSRLQVVPDVGHAVHLEAPDVCAELVGEFLDSP